MFFSLSLMFIATKRGSNNSSSSSKRCGMLEWDRERESEREWIEAKEKQTQTTQYIMWERSLIIYHQRCIAHFFIFGVIFLFWFFDSFARCENHWAVTACIFTQKKWLREREREIVLYIVIFLSLSLFCTLRVCVCMYVFILGPLLQVKTIYFRMFIAQRALKTHSLFCSLCV